MVIRLPGEVVDASDWDVVSMISGGTAAWEEIELLGKGVDS